MKIKNIIIDFLILFLCIILLFISSEPILYPDSQRYLTGALDDPPLYSMIIEIKKATFGNLNAVIIFQTLSVGFGIIYLTRTISIHLNINLLTKTIVSLFLFLPIIKFYDYLLTEPIGYALSLLFISFVIKLIYKFNYSNLVWSTFFAIMLLLTRNQFIFLYPTILLLYLGLFYIYNSRKVFLILLASFLSIFIIHNSLLFLNTYIKQGNFNNESLSYVKKGPYFYAYFDAIYISSAEDIKLFKSENIKKALTKIFDSLEDKKLLFKHYDGRGHYKPDTIRKYDTKILLDLADQEKRGFIDLRKEITLTLIKQNFKKYIKHIFKKVYDSTWLFIIVPFFIFISSSISFLIYKSPFSLLVLFISAFTIANHILVYIFGDIQPRYLIYTDFVFLIFIFIVSTVLLEKKLNKNNLELG